MPKPIIFKEINRTFAKDQPPYLPLTAFQHQDDWLCVTSCWGLNFIERIKVLFTGKIWVSMPTFGKPLTPVKIDVNKPTLRVREEGEI